MKLRKLIILFLAALMAVTFIGCGEKEPEPETTEAILQLFKDIKPAELKQYYIKADSEKTIEDLSSANYIVSKDYDYENVKAALENLRQENRWEKITTVETENYDEAISRFLSEDNSVLIGQDDMLAAVNETVKYGGIVEKVKSAYEYNPETAKDFSLTEGPFQVALFGSDERKGLKVNSRYDTNMLVTVNPQTKQILVVSIPRDSMLPNHAYGDQKDKLTHCGDNGPENSLYALNWFFKTNYEKYVLMSFQEFTNFIDLIGGIDVYNAKGFKYGYQKDLGYFEQGNIHLNGYYALYFARERWHLNNGDFDRNANAIVLLKGIINQLLKYENLAKFNEVYQSLRDCFYTNIPEDEILGFATMQFKDFTQWEIISYHIMGSKSYDWCPSYKTNAASVHPYQSDADFAAGEMAKMMNGETISQGSLPSGR